MSKLQIRIPGKLGREVFPKTHPRGAVRYRGAHGGRGSGKSFSFATMAAYWGAVSRMRVLCVREFQASIKESFHAELKAAIAASPWLSARYDVGVDYLRGLNGTEFLFRGLHRAAGTIKSTAGIDLTIVEEAEDVTEEAWLALEATVFRRPKSEMWVIWNPRRQGSPVDKRFRINKPADALVCEVNWNDNPWFPSGLVSLREHQRETLDPDTYAHVWEGGYLTNSIAQVLHGKVEVQSFEPQPGWDGPYQGADWGFAQDPTTLVRLWIDGDRLMVEHEAYGIGVDIDKTPTLFDQMPRAREYATRADSARPETISYMQRHGYERVQAAVKWPGSVEDGVAFLRGFRRIVIHPRCTHAIEESRLWSYKTDRLTGDVLPVLVDANNHIWDAARYALAPLIRKRDGMLVWMRDNAATMNADGR